MKIGRMTNAQGQVRCEEPHPTLADHMCVNFLDEGDSCKEHGCLMSDRRGEIFWMQWQDEDWIVGDK